MEKSHPTEMAAEIVAAFVSNNSVPRSELSALFETVHAAVKRLAEEGAVAAAESPAVPIRKSVSPDYLICLDDGLKFKSLRRHLSTLGMTPDQYRAKWNLPDDYPMVASNYAARRSELAKKIGFGHLRKKAVPSRPRSRRLASAIARPLARVRSQVSATTHDPRHRTSSGCGSRRDRARAAFLSNGEERRGARLPPAAIATVALARLRGLGQKRRRGAC
jgi:predicted transcriptional regulator